VGPEPLAVGVFRLVAHRTESPIPEGRVGSGCQVGCGARRGARITTPDEARVNYGGLGYNGTQP